MTEQEKMIETVMAFSPIERRIDMYGCEIGVSRQWYNEATAILMKINEGKYLKVPEGTVVLTREEYESLRQNLAQTTNRECELADRARALLHECDVLKIDLENVRKETAKEFAEKLKNYIRQNEVQTTFFGNQCFIDEGTIDELLKEYEVEE